MSKTESTKGALHRRPDGMQYAGTHLFIDMWGAQHTDNETVIRTAILDAVEESGAKLLKLEMSAFGEHAGVTAFAILAESHICINTWYEEQMIALDVFFCAGLDPYLCLPALEKAFSPKRIQVSEHKRLLASPMTHDQALL